MRRVLLTLALSVVAPSLTAQAPRFPINDPVLRRIWDEGTARSAIRGLAHTLMDSIGPRLTGSPADIAGHDWLIAKYKSWGIPASNEQYAAGGKRWRRGATHVDLIAPRVRTLEATMQAWSPGTKGPVEGEAVLFPTIANQAAFDAWLPAARGKLVLLSAEPPTCRNDTDWERNTDTASVGRMLRERSAAEAAWTANLKEAGTTSQELPRRLEAAGVLGILVQNWHGRYGWSDSDGEQYMGVLKLDGATTDRAPMIALSCEDYGLVSRLARSGAQPRIRVNADAELLGPSPVLNTIAEIRGNELPDEYVVLSAHFDSWDAASGATDNGTGTMVMMEAMRILKQVYPRPKRTIIVRHWSGEEQGIGTTRAFRADMTAVAGKTQAVFNQDTGTGRVTRVSIGGMPDGARAWSRWASVLPVELSYGLAVGAPGTGRDPMRDLCQGFPVYQLFSNGTANANNAEQSWSYGVTHHSNRDTYDKVIFDEVAKNAMLTAIMAYMASEDPVRTASTAPTVEQVDPLTGAPKPWPSCPLPAPFK